MSRLNLKNIIKNSEKIEPKSYCETKNLQL